MPVQRGRSGLLDKLGPKLDAAVRQHADDDTDYGFTRLPGGISNGIAKLTKCYFDQYKPGSNMKRVDGSSAVGEYYFRAEGVVVSPESVLVDGKDFKVAGLQTSIMIPVLDTKNSKSEVTTLEEQVDRILNEMRKLGGEEFTRGATASDLEGLASSLAEAGPCFRFSTSLSNPPPGSNFAPRVWENWNGSKGLEDYTPETPTEAVTDQTAKTPTNGKGKAAATSPATTRNGSSKPAPATTRQATTTAKNRTNKMPEPEPVDEFGDIDSLVELAEQEDGNAQTRLREMAASNGYSEEEIDEASDWQAVAVMAGRAWEERGEPEQEDSGEEVVALPNKGDVCLYKTQVRDPKTKKLVIKSIECDIVAVNRAKMTVDLKSLVDGKEYKGIAWDAIETA